MSFSLSSVAYLHGHDDQIEQVLPELVEAGWEIESKVDDFCCLTMESQHVPNLEFLALENRGLKCVASTHDCQVNYLWHQSVVAGSFLATQRGFGRVEPQGYGIQEFHRNMLSGPELPQHELCELVSQSSLPVKIPDLVQLTLEEARLLSKHVGILLLPALKDITPEVARELVRHSPCRIGISRAARCLTFQLSSSPPAVTIAGTAAPAASTVTTIASTPLSNSRSSGSGVRSEVPYTGNGRAPARSIAQHSAST